MLFRSACDSLFFIANTPTHFALDVNFLKLSQYSSAAKLNLMTHELGHALGFGLGWVVNNNYLDGTLYPHTLNTYNGLVPTLVDNTVIPVESSGSSQTKNKHWEDNYRILNNGIVYPGISNDIMKRNLRENLIISPLTINYLVDIGYVAKNPGASEGNPILVYPVQL